MCLIKRWTTKVSYFFDFFKISYAQSKPSKPVDQLKTPLNPTGFRLTLAPNVSRSIIPSRQATTLRSGLLEGTRWAGCVQAPHHWITRTALHRWIVGRSARGDPIGCARLLAHHWLHKKRCYWAQKETKLWLGRRIASFFCIVCSVFCERVGSIFCIIFFCIVCSVFCIVLFVLYKCKMTKFYFIMQNGHKLYKNCLFLFI